VLMGRLHLCVGLWEIEVAGHTGDTLASLLECDVLLVDHVLTVIFDVHPHVARA